MLDDLKSAVESSADGRPLSAPEREMLHRLASYTSGDPLLAGPNLIARIRSAGGGATGLAKTGALAGELAWRAHTAWRAREYREAARLTRAALRLCGLRGILPAMSKQNAGVPSSA